MWIVDIFKRLFNIEMLYILLLTITYFSIYAFNVYIKLNRRDKNKNINKIMKEVEIIAGSKKIRKSYIFSSKCLNASNSINGTIFIYKEWLKKLADNELILAFKQTIGHEVMHAFDIKYRWSYRKTKEIRRLYHWSCEVHCDIEGLNLALKKSNGGEKRNQYMEEIKKKAEVIIAQKGCDVPTNSHPSWKNRVKWMEKYTKFDKNVIYEIARELGIEKCQSLNDICSSWERMNNVITKS